MASQLSRQIGANLKAARTARGLTQRQVANLIDTESFQVSRWERGANRPADATLQRLAEVFEMELAEFFTEPDANGEPVAA